MSQAGSRDFRTRFPVRVWRLLCIQRPVRQLVHDSVLVLLGVIGKEGRPEEFRG